MQITLSSPTHLRISWSLYSSEIDHEIRQRLATVPGIEAGRGREAWAPIIQLARLMELYPKASIGYETMCAADDLALAFYSMLVRFDIRFDFDEFGDPMVAADDNVSPLIQQLVHERRHALKQFVMEVK